MNQNYIIILGMIILLSSCSVREDNPAYIRSEITITAVGDISLAGVYDPSRRLYITNLINIYKTIKKKYGTQAMIEYPFKRVKHVLTNSDLAVCNWEAVSASNIDYYRSGKKYYILGPPEYIKCIKNIFNVANLANNHMFDYGYQGMFQTRQGLKESGIQVIGAGFDLDDARKPVIINRKDVNIGFLGYSQLGVFAKTNQPGVAGAESLTQMALMVTEDLNLLKKKADIIVVSFHWGKEYSSYYESFQKELGRLTIEAGASVVLGHHTHSAQGIVRYKNGLICYSLGNFLFGASTEGEKESYILKITINKKRVINYEIIPVSIYPPDTFYSVRLLTGDKKNKYIKYLNSLSH